MDKKNELKKKIDAQVKTSIKKIHKEWIGGMVTITDKTRLFEDLGFASDFVRLLAQPLTKISYSHKGKRIFKNIGGQVACIIFIAENDCEIIPYIIQTTCPPFLEYNLSP